MPTVAGVCDALNRPHVPSQAARFPLRFGLQAPAKPLRVTQLPRLLLQGIGGLESGAPRASPVCLTAAAPYSPGRLPFR